MLLERWLPVPDWEYYSVSDRGRVRNDRTGLILSPGTHPKSGYQVVVLSIDRVRKTFTIHTLVLAAFVGPAPQGMEALHWDDVPAHNDLSNLRYGTRSENLRDAVRNGRHHAAAKVKCINGHQFTPASTGITKRGHRYCRTCTSIRNAARSAPRKVSA